MYVKPTKLLKTIINSDRINDTDKLQELYQKHMSNNAKEKVFQKILSNMPKRDKDSAINIIKDFQKNQKNQKNANAKENSNGNTQSPLSNKKTKNRYIILSVICVITVAAICAISQSISDSQETSKIYSISVVDAIDEQCSDDNAMNECSGTIELSADLTEDGKIPEKTIELTGSKGGEFSDDIRISDGKNTLTLPSIEFNEESYGALLSDGKHETSKESIILKSKSTGKERAKYNLKIIYKLTDNDKTILANLEQKRQERIAEEQRKIAEEAARKQPYPYEHVSGQGMLGTRTYILISGFDENANNYKDRIKATIKAVMDSDSKIDKKSAWIDVFIDRNAYIQEQNSGDSEWNDNTVVAEYESYDYSSINRRYGTSEPSRYDLTFFPYSKSGKNPLNLGNRSRYKTQ